MDFDTDTLWVCTIWWSLIEFKYVKYGKCGTIYHGDAVALWLSTKFWTESA